MHAHPPLLHEGLTRTAALVQQYATCKVASKGGILLGEEIPPFASCSLQHSATEVHIKRAYTPPIAMLHVARILPVRRCLPETVWSARGTRPVR